MQQLPEAVVVAAPPKVEQTAAMIEAEQKREFSIWEYNHNTLLKTINDISGLIKTNERKLSKFNLEIAKGKTSYKLLDDIKATESQIKTLIKSLEFNNKKYIKFLVENE